MLAGEQLRRWVDYFGTPESQIRRDHFISHLLLRLPDIVHGAVFFGGTSLSRTHLPRWRLSEDVDLLVASPAEAMDALDAGLERALRREFPSTQLRWSADGDTAVGRATSDDLAVQLQLVKLDSSYSRYPTVTTRVELRYEDLPGVVELKCPTRDSAAAMKLIAWADRWTPRDLCDLYGLEQASGLTSTSLTIAADVSRPVQIDDFSDDRLPSEAAWRAALDHQMRAPPQRDRALLAVRSTIGRLLDSEGKKGKV